MIKERIVIREELFIISKVWFDEVEHVEAACRRSFKRLEVDYLDLYLVHWPVAIKKLQKERNGSMYEKINLPM